MEALLDRLEKGRQLLEEIGWVYSTNKSEMAVFYTRQEIWKGPSVVQGRGKPGLLLSTCTAGVSCNSLDATEQT